MSGKITLVFDFETTTFQKGNVFSQRNYPVLLVIYHVEDNKHYVFYEEDMDRQSELVLSLFNTATHIIGFNLKFDLLWLRRKFDIVLPNIVQLFDCQQAEFLFSCQTMKYPSLNECCARHDLPQKFDVVKEKYWNKGIDTPEIPQSILEEYCVQDVDITYQLFLKQLALFMDKQNSKYKLFRIAMQDLPVLMDMEWNGLAYNVDKSKKIAEDLQSQVDSIEEKLNALADNIPINWGSGQQVSKFLYGGTIEHEYKVPIGVFKTGNKVGQTRFKNMIQEYKLPGLFEPLKGSEMAKDGIYSTDEATLRSLKGNKTQKKVIEWLLQRTKLCKAINTYFLGLPKKIEEMDWADNILHPSYNQCVTVTGRIASANPNGQNMPAEAKQLCESVYHVC
jgi:DNA polymerase I-like protein with 3'-5' exonuclease and polymerase domains